MLTQKPLSVEVQVNPHPVPSILVPSKIVFEVHASCPFCDAEAFWIKRYGFYPRKDGEAQRYWCKHCDDTFNAAKLPEIQKLMQQTAWRLAELVVQQGLAVNALADVLGVPEKTLREVIKEIRQYIARNLVVIKDLPYEPTGRSPSTSPELHVIFVDEGFIKVAGTQWFLVFGVDSQGRPLYAELLPGRNTEDLRGCLEQCEKVLGNLDVVVSDGLLATHAALRRWAHPIIHIQHIHTGSKERVELHEIVPLEGNKEAKVTTVILHTKSLNTNQESYFEAKEQIVKTPPLKQTSRRKKKRKGKKRKTKRDGSHLKHVLTPPDQNSCFSSQQRLYEKLKRKKARTQLKKRKKTSSLKKPLYKFHLVIDSTGKGWELIELAPEEGSEGAPIGFTEKVLKLLAVTSEVFENKCIQSNRAETFNSIHDRVLSYLGRKTGEQAQRDLDAWQAMKYYPKRTRGMLRGHKIHFSLSLVKVLLPWGIAKVEIR